MRKRDEEIDEMVSQQEQLEMESYNKPSLWQRAKKGFSHVKKQVSDRVDNYRANRDLTWDQNREQNALSKAERDYKEADRKEKKLAKKEQKRLETEKKQLLWLQNTEQEALDKAEYDYKKEAKKINRERLAEQEKQNAEQEKQLSAQDEYTKTNF